MRMMYNDGAAKKEKIDGKRAEKKMKTAIGEDGKLLFTPEEYLTATQIGSFFSSHHSKVAQSNAQQIITPVIDSQLIDEESEMLDEEENLEEDDTAEELYEEVLGMSIIEKI
jgi:hypothetical protein